MQPLKPAFRKVLGIVFKSIKILVLALVVLFAAVYIYVSANKKKIIDEVTAEISKRINGSVTIGDVDLSFFRNFPKVAVRVKDIKVKDTMYAVHKHVFFESRNVYMLLNVYKLIRKKAPVNGIRIEDGSIYLYTDVNGYTNAYLLKPKATAPDGGSAPAADDPLRSVRLDHVRITINDLQREKLHDFVVDRLMVKLDAVEDGRPVYHTDAGILVESLAFNTARGSFIKGKYFKGDFDLVQDKQKNQLQFDSIDVRIDGQRFNLTGRFDLGKDSPQFSLRIHTNGIGYEKVRTLVPAGISRSLSIVRLSKPVDADVDMSGPLKGGEPLLFIHFAAKDAQLKTTFMDFDGASFAGYYTNEVIKGLPRKDPNSKILVSNFTASWHGLPMTVKYIEILDLIHPKLTADLQSEFPLQKLNQLIGTRTIALQSGTGSVQLHYQGPIERNNNTNSFLNGAVSFKEGNILYAPYNVEMKNVNGAISFKNSDVFIQDLRTTVLDNAIIMNGTAKNLLTLINTAPSQVSIDYNIFSPAINIGAFTYLLRSRSSAGTKSSLPKSDLGDVASKIDNILEQGNLHVNLRANSLTYKKFVAENVQADISLLQDRYAINKVSMQHAGGTMNLSGVISNQPGTTHKVTVDAGMNSVDVKKVFSAFSNFGQDGITAESLEGSLTAKVNASMLVSDDGSVVPSSINSIVDFSLKNGALNNYEPVKKLQNILFKNRDFENIKFAELKDRLEIHNQDIKINRMEIQSSVLSMFVEGIFSNRGNTDISIQVPLNNLKKRESDYVPENIGTDAKGGRSLFLRGQPGSDGNVKFKLDIFKKYRKEKEQP